MPGPVYGSRLERGVLDVITEGEDPAAASDIRGEGWDSSG